MSVRIQDVQFKTEGVLALVLGEAARACVCDVCRKSILLEECVALYNQSSRMLACASATSGVVHVFHRDCVCDVGTCPVCGADGERVPGMLRSLVRPGDRFGIDVGGVLMGHASSFTGSSGGEDTIFSKNYLASPAAPGALDGVRTLVQVFGAENVFIVSKAGERTQQRTLHWLEHHAWYQRTGLLPENVHFCRTRKQKQPIAQSLRLTHFIDDRQEVLRYVRQSDSMRTLVWMQPAGSEGEAPGPDILPIFEWHDLIELFARVE